MSSHSISPEDLRQEVVELTELLRDDESFRDVYNLVISKGLTIGDVLLAGLVENEDTGDQYGLLVVEDGQCVVFELDRYGSVKHWERIDDVSVLDDEFFTVAVAVAMKRSGDVP
ncbi:hypothetical protein ACQEVZ_18985 [Dactylosporangium sp. CA-152071]|uniref:hypothetical protein n=1 Tax=Dactylosporangium sp. CA-152071 TaxID=3239933 RepID=UPI003D8E6B1C